MARGSLAKERIVAKLRDAFGENWIGEDNKKFFVWEQDEEGKVQIAITLTCPKNEIACGQSGQSFPEAGTSAAQTEPPQTEITTEERENIAALMAKLGL